MSHLAGLIRWWATLTAGMGQFLLTLLGILLCSILSGTVLPTVNAAQVSGADAVPSAIGGLILLGSVIAVLGWQFARRRTTLSRAWLAFAVVLFPILHYISPYRAIIGHKYPPATPAQQSTIQLTFDPKPFASREPAIPIPEKKRVPVKIPLLVSGMENGSVVDVGGMLETIRGNGRIYWSSGWHGGGVRFLAGRPHAALYIAVDRNFFESAKATPVNLHITLALVPSVPRETTQTVARGDGFALPGEGRCSFSASYSDLISCYFPLKSPLLLLNAKSGEITCPARKNETSMPADTVLSGWIGDGDSGPAEFGLSPVALSPLFLGDLGDLDIRDYRPRICPGTPLTIISNWQKLPRYRTELEIDGFSLADYELKNTPQGAEGFGVLVP